MNATYGRFDTRYKLRTWDEGFGPLWIYAETMGPVGVVRAQSWEEAYQCVEDEIMDDADVADSATYARDYDPKADEGDLAEGCHWRSNGTPSNPELTSPIAQEDLNGSTLVRLDSAEGKRIAEEWGVQVELPVDVE